MKLFLLDAYALIYRAYYAFIDRPLTNSKGQHTSTVWGFLNTLEDVLTRERPTHIGVAFDPKGGTFRHEAYEQYKAQREATPEDIAWSVPVIKQILEAYRIPILEVAGFEADDVIGTLATQAGERGIETYMMTPDKDYGQLVSEHVRIYRPRHNQGQYEVMGVDEVLKKYWLEKEQVGIASTEQVIDILGLMGDASDNIPGCPGVGEKTAVKLLAQFGSIENLLASTDQLKGALKQKIEDNREQIEFSRFLATIRRDVPIELDMDLLALKEPDEAALRQMFADLEMRSLMKKKFGDSTEVAKPKPAPKPVASRDDSGMRDLFDMFDEAETVETAKNTDFTASADLPEDVLVGHDLKQQLSRLAAEGRAGERSLFDINTEDRSLFDIKNEEKPQFDIRATDKPLFDIMIAHYLLHPELKHDLAYMAETMLGETVSEDNRGQVIAALYRQLEPQMRDNRLFRDIEMPLVPVLAQMERNGVRLDVPTLQASSADLRHRLGELEAEAYKQAGVEFNLGSPKQVGEVLFDRLRIDPKAKRSKGGNYATNEDTLRAYATVSPVVPLILEHRGIKKLLSTYVDALPALINPMTGHIHTTFNQAVTVTGRLSSSNPNLQNIPIRDEGGRFIRSAFIPEEGERWFSADYSQIELRLMAHLSGDETLVGDFLSGHDIHAATAAKIFHKPVEEVTRTERTRAKTANFGIIYGITTFGLAERLEMPRGEAKELIEGYFATYPGVRQYMDESIAKVRECGYAETLFGRRCYLPDINSRNATVRGFAERNAINAPIQGTAADIIKIAMVRVQQRLWREGMKSKLILQVHDELNFSVPKDEEERLQQLVMEEMQNVVSLRVPLIADGGWGANWLEAH